MPWSVVFEFQKEEEVLECTMTAENEYGKLSLSFEKFNENFNDLAINDPYQIIDLEISDHTTIEFHENMFSAICNINNDSIDLYGYDYEITAIKKFIVDMYTSKDIPLEYVAKDNGILKTSKPFYLHPTPTPNYILPASASNAIVFNKIQEGNNMIDFHDEYKYGRYYKQSTYNDYIKPTRENPFTRKSLSSKNIQRYKAKFSGGKRTKRTQRKNNKSRQRNP